MEITGRLTRDAKLTSIKPDKKVINFSIALNDSYKSKGSDTLREITTYIDCDYWLSPAVAPYLRKGSLVSLFGLIGLSLYLSAEGNPRGSITFHVNHLKILAFAKKETAGALPAVPSNNNTEDPDDLPF